jgi:outer membrane lipoprotein-sorting protein
MKKCNLLPTVVGLLTAANLLAVTPASADAPAAAPAAPAEVALAPLDAAGAMTLVKQVDDRQRNSGDYKTLMYIERKEKDKNDVVFDAVIYRRDVDDKLMILFLQPKSERGKGYLRIDKNLWMYDPTVGKWERRTERERIGGTDSRRNDFDESRLAEEYEVAYDGVDKLGKLQAHKLTLNVKKGVDVAYPKVTMWVSPEGNVLKRMEYAASGKLMRRTLTPKWAHKYSESKKAEVWTPKEIYIFDEVEKGNQTTILMKEQDLRPLAGNLFTKAWLESQSR